MCKNATKLLDETFSHINQNIFKGMTVNPCPCLVVELDGAGDGLGEGEAGGLGGDGAQLVPLLLGDVLGHQAVLGLDVGEVARHVAAEKTQWWD